MIKALLARVRRFGADDPGTVTLETIVVLPVVLWAFVATFVFYDAFAARAASQRAAFNISDAIGRQHNSVLTPADLVSYNRIFAFLSRTQPTTRLRVTSIIWNPITLEHNIVWSYSPNGGTPMTAEDLTPPVLARLPVLPQQESIFIVETWLDFRPITRSLPLMGEVLRPQTLREFVVSRPRFAPQLRFNDGTGLVGTTFPTCDDPGVICGVEGTG